MRKVRMNINEVETAKIKISDLSILKNGNAILYFNDMFGIDPICVSQKYLNEHKPTVGEHHIIHRVYERG